LEAAVAAAAVAVTAVAVAAMVAEPRPRLSELVPHRLPLRWRPCRPPTAARRAAP